MSGHPRLPLLDSGRGHLVDGAGPVARRDIDGRDRVGQHASFVAQANRIERGGLDAVVGREADDDDPSDAAATEHRVELRRDLLPGRGVARAEPGVAVLAVDTLADPWRLI